MATSTRRNVVPTRFGLALEVVSVLAVVAAIVVTASAWGSLPERIPSHFGAAGQPDAFGSRGYVLVPVGLAVGLYLLFSLVQRIPPRFYNYPVQISADNAAAQYSLARTFIALLKAGLSVFLAGGTWLTVQVALGQREGLGVFFLPGVLVAVFVPMIWYRSAAYRQRKA